MLTNTIQDHTFDPKMNILDDCTSEERSNLSSTYVQVNIIKPIIACTKCDKNPAMNSLIGICILCTDNLDTKQACYDYDSCQKTRQYLKETDDNFSLEGYTVSSTEVWKCQLCNYYLQFDMQNPGLARDILHEKSRKIHLDKWCQYLAKQIIIKS